MNLQAPSFDNKYEIFLHPALQKLRILNTSNNHPSFYSYIVIGFIFVIHPLLVNGQYRSLEENKNDFRIFPRRSTGFFSKYEDNLFKDSKRNQPSTLPQLNDIMDKAMKKVKVVLRNLENINGKFHSPLFIIIFDNT